VDRLLLRRSVFSAKDNEDGGSNNDNDDFDEEEEQEGVINENVGDGGGFVEENEEETECHSEGRLLMQQKQPPRHNQEWLVYVWKELFRRQLFGQIAPLPRPGRVAMDKSSSSLSGPIHILDELRYRRKLLSNLCGGGGGSSGAAALQLRRALGSGRFPDRCFSFIPLGAKSTDGGGGGDGIIPTHDNDDDTEQDDEDDDDDDDDDHPPVPFECDCFLLLTPTSSEYLLLHPMTGQFTHGDNLGVDFFLEAATTRRRRQQRGGGEATANAASFAAATGTGIGVGGDAEEPKPAQPVSPTSVMTTSMAAAPPPPPQPLALEAGKAVWSANANAAVMMQPLRPPPPQLLHPGHGHRQNNLLPDQPHLPFMMGAAEGIVVADIIYVGIEAKHVLWETGPVEAAAKARVAAADGDVHDDAVPTESSSQVDQHLLPLTSEIDNDDGNDDDTETGNGDYTLNEKMPSTPRFRGAQSAGAGTTKQPRRQQQQQQGPHQRQDPTCNENDDNNHDDPVCHGSVGSTVVAVGRQLVLLSRQEQEQTRGRRARGGLHDDDEDHDDDDHDSDDRPVMTEVFSWERRYESEPPGRNAGVASACEEEDDGDGSRSSSLFPLAFGSPRVCRFRHPFYTMDLDAANHQLLVVPVKDGDDGQNNHDEDHRRNDANHGEDDEGNAEARIASCGGSRSVRVYPLVPVLENFQGVTTTPNHHPMDENSYFPSPVTTLHCEDGITALACSGNAWVVSTASGKLLWYETQRLRHSYNIMDYVREALSRCHHSHHHLVSSSRSTSTSTRVNKERDELILQSIARASVDAIRFPTFVGPCRAGFVTLSFSDQSGSTLLLWKKDREKRLLYHIDAVVQLPLLARRSPKIQYDGRRLLVYGQDHIGYIILVYKVVLPDDGENDTSAFSHPLNDCDASGPSKAKAAASAAATERAATDGSGAGVIVSETLRFVRRIRHAALGGHADYESLHLSANERFVVANTKLGHELAGGRRGGADGLLVIDVEQADASVEEEQFTAAS
jgi:hypothetical protein